MARGVRTAGVVPLLVAIAAAVALTGTAVFTVAKAGCENPGQYVQHDGIIELVGGCIEREDLPVGPREPANNSDTEQPQHVRP